MDIRSNYIEYSAKEESLNIYTHAFGFVLSILGLILLIATSFEKSSVYFWSFLIFGLSMCVLYLASTLYHRAKKPVQRAKLQIFDHCAIYVLIAGTYTPFTLITLPEDIGHMIFAIVWVLALMGVLLKLFFTGRFGVLSTILYVAMGWLIVSAYTPLVENLPEQGVAWLFAGGLGYTLGAILYSIKRIPYNHAIFHVFVLAGSFCHFWVVYSYI